MTMKPATALLLASLSFPYAAVAQTAPKDLPDGPEKQLVESACSACHEPRRILNSNYSPDEWRNVIAMMVNFGAQIPKDRIAAVTDYLIRAVPERPKPEPVLLSGPMQVSIREWDVPTPGSRPHDPWVGTDGGIWYSGQMANVLGHLDTTTGQTREYRLDIEQSAPHGIVADPQGQIWFTANNGGYIGRMDPATGKVTKTFDMPDPAIRDPHTLKFDTHGRIFFTAQNANVVGRLDPATGEIKVVSPPTPKSQPYGMVINSKGVPFFDEFGAPKIGSLDPETLAIREYALPDPASRPRRIAITSDDVIWYTDYARGRLGRLDPATGKVTEFPSPSGPRSQPYAITALDDALWYVESGARPNALVRFDPKAGTFQSWVIPSGGGVVRNMVVTPDHDIAIACSAVNKIGLVHISRAQP
jgi:virginiamycin B lyase